MSPILEQNLYGQLISTFFNFNICFGQSREQGSNFPSLRPGLYHAIRERVALFSL